MVSEKPKNARVEIPGAEIVAETNDVGPQQRHRDPNRSKFVVEEKTGRSWSDSLGRFVSYHRKIDRENDTYYERIVDDKTGDVLRECSEPLSVHVGRGSASKNE